MAQNDLSPQLLTSMKCLPQRTIKNGKILACVYQWAQLKTKHNSEQDHSFEIRNKLAALSSDLRPAYNVSVKRLHGTENHSRKKTPIGNRKSQKALANWREGTNSYTSSQLSRERNKRRRYLPCRLHKDISQRTVGLGAYVDEKVHSKTQHLDQGLTDNITTGHLAHPTMINSVNGQLEKPVKATDLQLSNEGNTYTERFIAMMKMAHLTIVQAKPERKLYFVVDPKEISHNISDAYVYNNQAVNSFSEAAII